jgi:hypothetical protein
MRVYLPPEVDTSLLQARAQEVGLRPSEGRRFFPDERGRALRDCSPVLCPLSRFERGWSLAVPS